MGRSRKPFIDKKNSITYRLVYKCSEYGEEGGERIFIPVRGNGSGVAGMGDTSEPPKPLVGVDAMRFFWGGEEPTDEERKTIVSLGLPDDGYNYLQHIRTLGRKRVHLDTVDEEVEDPHKEGEGSLEMSGAGARMVSAFNPPPEDRKVINARGLSVREEVVDEETAEHLSSASSAFSREVQGIRGKVAREFDEIDEAMEMLDDAAKTVDSTTGVGDLLDDFVLTAAQADENATTLMGDARLRDKPQHIAMPEDIDEDSEEDIIEYDHFSRYSGTRGLGNQSHFSEKWARTSASDLEGRRARNDHLSLLDERFDKMLMQYDDEELGDLEDCEEEEIQGCSDLRDFSEELGTLVDDLKTKGFRAVVRDIDTNIIAEKDEDVIAITKQLEAASIGGRRRVGREEWEDVLVCVQPNSSRLDCETVLSYRSKASSFQPSRISVISKSPKSYSAAIVASGEIELSSKTGFPSMESSIRSKGSEMIPEEHPLVDTAPNPVPLERKKGETPEERRARKSAVKELQRDAKARKKELKMLYRKEHVKQQKQTAGMATKNATIVTL